jgi:hypothetical protein
MNNKTIIILIAVILVLTIAIVSWKTPSTATVEITPTVTTTTTPEITDIPSETPTPTVSTSTTPTVTPSVTVTPTTTPSSDSTFQTQKSSEWIYGVKEQKVGSSVYFIDASDNKIIKKGTSNTDSGAQAVYTSDNNGAIGSFYVNGTYMYVVTRRDSATSYSKFKRVLLSNGTATKLFELYSAKYDAVQFAVRVSNDVKTSFYLGLEGTDHKYEPAAFYAMNYVQQWIKPFAGIDKNAIMTGIAPTQDGNKLLSIYTNNSTTIEGDIVLVTPTVTP